jgi:hypothetical protein
MKEKLYDSWTFTEKDLDQDQWYVQLKGGKHDGVVYCYNSIKLLPDDESMSFDYDVVDYLYENPHGSREFNEAVGQILLKILEDATAAKDYVIGERDTDDSK